MPSSRTSGDANDRASETLEVVAEPVDPNDDFDRIVWGGAIVDVLLSTLTVGPWGIGTPVACVRVRERSDGTPIFVIPCGRDAALAERVAESMRRDLERLTRDEFFAEFHIDPSHRAPEYRRAYLGIGSNLGDRLFYLQLAVVGAAGTEGVEVMALSRVYETEPVGGPEQDPYLNAVMAVDTTLTSHELLDLAHQLEAQAERVRDVRWGPRTLDVDVLMVGDEKVDDPDLEIPHPRIPVRGFVLAPLHDFLPSGLLDLPPNGWPGVRRTDLSLRVP